MATILTTTYDSITNSNALTITLASLASSATLVAGRESTVVDNTSNLFVDAILSGRITTGTTPTVDKAIEVWLFGSTRVVSSTFSYPTATATQLGSGDAAATFGSVAQKNNLRLAWVSSNSATSDVALAIGPVSVAAAFGGVMPLKWGVFVTHSTGVNLNATAGNHFLHYSGIKFTST